MLCTINSARTKCWRLSNVSISWSGWPGLVGSACGVQVGLAVAAGGADRVAERCRAEEHPARCPGRVDPGRHHRGGRRDMPWRSTCLPCRAACRMMPRSVVTRHGSPCSTERARVHSNTSGAQRDVGGVPGVVGDLPDLEQGTVGKDPRPDGAVVDDIAPRRLRQNPAGSTGRRGRGRARRASSSSFRARSSATHVPGAIILGETPRRAR